MQLKSVFGVIAIGGMLLMGPFTASPISAAVITGHADTQISHGSYMHGEKKVGHMKMLETVSQLTGLTPEQIKTQRKNGKSLAQIAQSKGISEDKLIATIMEPIKFRIQKKVAEGKFTPEKAKEILTKKEQRVRTRVNCTTMNCPKKVKVNDSVQ